MKDFAAIDFETANEQPSSVCSVGVVIVRDGQIVDSFYSLIHPEPEYYQWFCQDVHGLGPEDTDDAPVFPYVWEKIAPKIEDCRSWRTTRALTRGVSRPCSRFIRWTIRITYSTTLSPHRGFTLGTVSPIISYRLWPPPADTTSQTTITHLQMRKLVRILR